ncbi:HNH endonuclease [Alkalinema pantanalense CENA528]|uniref:HNH endonuclease n=1 Tax=Alkalinema pantanalense TaxID=1620705 RepID=UPI003D6FBC30
MAINDAAKKIVRQRANYLCEYCHSPERLSANRFTVDHVRPRSLGGSDEIDNLALACRRCNERRYNFVAGIDPETQEIVPIFNPRQQYWGDHFVWTENGTVIQGVTPTGRATCIRLDLNDTRYSTEDSIRGTRQLWTRTRLHPPSQDPSV